MTVTAHINIDTPAGRRFVREMAKFPKVVEFENNTSTIEKTYSVDEVYNNGLDKLSGLYGVDMRMLKSKMK